ncbi:oxidoreductase [Enhygromyxa salina]|uniref:Putative ketoacyl reductase n=1 Tax=Enhygromyxa salina TaxID=215803 RepID=A0A2S9YAE9_9BACT|nr:oxidoreductase [Enhygromyxa salina]PRQ02075.1 putative ketoacyl reductase [Enhygromyxa salina]
MSSKHWTRNDIPDQTGKLAIVTGANSGIGLETARELARSGARVILACRSEAKAAEAIADIRGEISGASPSGSVEFMSLDLADLDEVERFAAAVHERFDRLDLLINNAGVMVPPYSTTKQGFELQLGVNHLGHFALTGRLLGLLLATPGARVVNVSSGAHYGGKLNFDDLDFEARRYKPMRAYSQSKLANLLFTLELGRKLEALGADVTVAAAHPGWTHTNLQQHASLFDRLNPLFAMQPGEGALPSLRAATAPDVRAGEYYGPGGLMQMRGAPVRVGMSKGARDEAVAARLWQVSEQRTGVTYDFGRAARTAA